MDVKQPQRSYTIIRPDDLPQVHRLMYQSFHLDEPMTKELGLNEVREESSFRIMLSVVREVPQYQTPTLWRRAW